MMTPITLILGQLIVLGAGILIGLKLKKITQEQENKRLVRIPVTNGRKRS